jgi:hypothetical protein
MSVEGKIILYPLGDKIVIKIQGKDLYYETHNSMHVSFSKFYRGARDFKNHHDTLLNIIRSLDDRGYYLAE